MNVKGLARYYDTLNPWERLPLILAASARGDDAERQRLIRSAAKISFSVPHYYGLSLGLTKLGEILMLQWLDWAAVSWNSQRVFAECWHWLPRSKADEQDEHMQACLQLIAYRFMLHRDGWKALGDGLHIDVDLALRYLPGFETVRQFEEEARVLAFTPEEARGCLRRFAEESKTVEADPAREPMVRWNFSMLTAVEVAAEMRKYLAEELAEWS